MTTAFCFLLRAELLSGEEIDLFLILLTYLALRSEPHIRPQGAALDFVPPWTMPTFSVSQTICFCAFSTSWHATLAWEAWLAPAPRCVHCCLLLSSSSALLLSLMREAGA